MQQFLSYLNQHPALPIIGIVILILAICIKISNEKETDIF